MSGPAIALVLAHAGHVLIDLLVFLGPVAAIATWLLVLRWRDRRAAARDDERESGREPR